MAQFRKRQLAFCVSNVCNMNCQYCITADSQNLSPYARLNMDFVREAIRDYYRDEGKIEIRIYGIGEPTAHMDDVRHIVEYAREVSPETSVELQTNGNFGPQVAHWIGQNCSMVWLSLDGPVDVQDEQRPRIDGRSSGKVIAENVEILKQYPNCKLGGRATITTLNLRRMADIVDYYMALGLDCGYCRPCLRAPQRGETSQGLPVFTVDLMEFARQYVPAYRYAASRSFFFGTFLTMNFDESTNVFCRAACALPFLTLDGYVSVCDMAWYFQPKLESLFIGKFDASSGRIEYWPNRIEKLKSRVVQNMEPCRSCSVRENCGGGCLGECAYQNRDVFVPCPEFCEAIQFLARELPRNQGRFPFFSP